MEGQKEGGKKGNSKEKTEHVCFLAAFRHTCKSAFSNGEKIRCNYFAIK